MTLAVLTIPGVAGDIVTETSFWSGFKFVVGGQRVKPRGFPRNRLTLPGTAGPVEATVKGGILRPHPTLVVGGTEYRTGPPTSRGLQISALLPLLTLALVQGFFGFLVAFGGVAINMGVLRRELPIRTKYALLGATLIAAIAVDVFIIITAASVLGT